MVYLVSKPASFQSSHTQYARASSSETAPPHGKSAKTPIIAGSVCGGILLIAWIIGFIIYFRKRSNRKKEKHAAIAAGLPPPELKMRSGTEKVVIPPDPATLFNPRRPGYETAPAVEKDYCGQEIGVGHDHEKGGPTGLDGHGSVHDEVEDKRPLLSTLPHFAAISAPKRYRTRGRL